MKIVVINGSPRKGSTYEAIQLVKAEMRKHGEVEFVDFNLPQDLPNFCRGCFQCFVQGEHICPDATYVQPIVEAMLASDGIIIGSPAYALQIPAGLKNLFDHMAYCFLNHRPRFFRHKALVLTTTAGAGIKNCNRYIKQNLTFWGFNKIYTYGQPILAAKWTEIPPDTKGKLLRNVERLGKVFYEDVASKRLHRPAFIQSVMFNASRALAKFSDDDSRDKQYWTKQGFIENDYHYFLKEASVPMTHRIVGAVTSLMFNRMLRKNSNSNQQPTSSSNKHA